MKMIEFNQKIRNIIGKPITVGFEYSGKAFYCPTHGFQNMVITEAVKFGVLGLPTDFVDLCPTCKLICTFERHNTEEAIKIILRGE